MTTNSSAGSYRHTQPGTMILTVTLGLAAVFAVAAALWLKPLCISVAVLLLAAWLFSSLTIEITGRELRWRFGPGLIHKSVPLAEIVSVEVVRTGPSWGIHLCSRLGWLYNVSGYDAVLVTLRGGKRFALGTDEPQILAARLEAAVRFKA
jgi:hypothetical protein